MPTVRQRHMITETDEVALALDAAARLWPEHAEERAELLRKLIAAGADAVAAQHASWRSARLEAIDTVAGSLTGLWPTGWHDELRNEWPA